MRENPSYFSKRGGDCPVENVSYEKVQRFIPELERKTSRNYHLPSEAEWEYACRAGKIQTYCGPDDVDAVAWYSANSENRPHPVAKKRPTDFGLYDMSGNVWEWTEDCWHDDYDGAPSDQQPWTSGDCARRVVRGGSWFHQPWNARSFNRNRLLTEDRYTDVGFRLLQYK